MELGWGPGRSPRCPNPVLKPSLAASPSGRVGARTGRRGRVLCLVHGAAGLAAAGERGVRGEARQSASIVRSGQTNAGDSAGRRFPSRARRGPTGSLRVVPRDAQHRAWGCPSPWSRHRCCHAAREQQHLESPRGRILTVAGQSCCRQGLAAAGERAWECAPEPHVSC